MYICICVYMYMYIYIYIYIYIYRRRPRTPSARSAWPGRLYYVILYNIKLITLLLYYTTLLHLIILHDITLSSLFAFQEAAGLPLPSPRLATASARRLPETWSPFTSGQSAVHHGFISGGLDSCLLSLLD